MPRVGGAVPTHSCLPHRMRQETLKCWQLPALLVLAAASPPPSEVGSPRASPHPLHLPPRQQGPPGEGHRTPGQLAWERAVLLSREEEGRSGHHPPRCVTSALVLSPAALRSRELPTPVPLSPARRLVMCLTLSLPFACCPICVHLCAPHSIPVPSLMSLPTSLCYPLACADSCLSQCAVPSWDQPRALPGKPLNLPIVCPWGSQTPWAVHECGPRVGSMPGTGGMPVSPPPLCTSPQCQASSSASRSPRPSLLSATTGAASSLPPSAPSSSVSLLSGTRMKVPQAG